MTDATELGPGESFEPWYTLELHIEPARVEDFLAAMREVVARSREEAGVLQYDLLRDRRAPNRFNLVQRYASLDAIRSHMQQPHAVTGLQQIAAASASTFVQTDWVSTGL